MCTSQLNSSSTSPACASYSGVNHLINTKYNGQCNCKIDGYNKTIATRLHRYFAQHQKNRETFVLITIYPYSAQIYSTFSQPLNSLVFRHSPSATSETRPKRVILTEAKIFCKVCACDSIQDSAHFAQRRLLNSIIINNNTKATLIVMCGRNLHSSRATWPFLTDALMQQLKTVMRRISRLCRMGN